MAGRLQQVVARSLLAAGIVYAGGAQALQIDGLNPLEPLSATLAAAAVGDGRLELKLADGRTLEVSEWPAFLPQRFGPQQVEASRRLRPAGPSDQLSFSRAGDSRPWLIVGSGARRGAILVGAWQLQLNGRLWSISDGATEKALGVEPRQAAPVQVMVESQRWCLYLLQTQLPKTRAGVASEDEPQISWAGWRLEGNRKRCPAAR